jgi:Tol biopolymer transport system component
MENPMPAVDLVSASTTGNAGNGSSDLDNDFVTGQTADSHVLSADGRFVVFTSSASDLVAGDTNGATDVFVRDLSTGTTQLVSVGNSGAQGDAGSFNPSISADGRYVAFASSADNLVSGDANGVTDVFVRDLVNHTTTLVSVDYGQGPTPVQGNGASFDPSISADGTKVAFASNASNLSSIPHPPGGSGISNVYVSDLTHQTIHLLSTDWTGVLAANQDSFNPVISADGNAVAFVSLATDITKPAALGGTTPVTTGTQNVYLIHISAVPGLPDAAPELISVDANEDGAGNSDSFNPTISADGRYVAFQSSSSNIVFTDPPPFSDGDIFLRDTLFFRETTTIISLATDGGLSDSIAKHPSISGDGRFVVFESGADDLVTGDPGDGIKKIYLIDLSTGTTTLVSTGLTNSDVTDPVISGDGRVVAFMSAANDFGFTDSNNASDVFAVTLPVAANDAPVATAPTDPYVATEQVNLSLKNTGLSVSDVDANGGSETVTLSVTEGTLTLAAGTSGAIIDSGNGTDSVTFHGTIAQLDALLNTDGTSAVSYIDSSANPAASATLSLSIDDGGHTGAGGPLTDTATAVINILGGGHAPGAFDFNFDANGNGHADILLQTNSGGVAIWDNGSPSGASTIADSMPSSWHLAGIGDFDGNGKTDILWTNDNGSVAIWDNSVTGHTIATGMPNNWHVAGTGDFDGNGKSDILWQNDSGAVAIWDDGQIGHTVAGPGSMLPANEHVVATGDFDGNGKTDILWQNTSNGALTVWANGQPAGAGTIANSMPSSWHVAGVGDFDGNGKSDILWQNDNGNVAIWDDGQIGHTIATGMPSSWHIAGVSDFDGNGKSDILWHNDNGAVAIWDNAQIGHTIAAPGTVVPDWHIIA